MTKVVVTGGTGSLGVPLVNKLVSFGHYVTVIHRNPHIQPFKNNPNVRDVILDIGDRGNLSELARVLRDQERLVHAAALKQVDSGEVFPIEFNRVNIDGTYHVASAWRSVNKAGKGVFLSTDKAVNSLNHYGATKRVGETIARNYDFSVLRYGNVVSSRGAVFGKWESDIAAGRPINVRIDELGRSPSRFYVEMAHAVDMVIELLFKTFPGTFVPKGLSSFDILDVATATGAEITKSRLGEFEKLHEILLAIGERPEWQSNNLVRVLHGHSEETHAYSSEFAPRISGPKFLKLIGWR